MQQVEAGALKLWQFDALKELSAVRHFVTGRGAAGPEQAFTLSYSSTPDKEAVRKNRGQLAAAMGLAAEQLFFPSQIHQTRIVAVTRHTTLQELMETDALLTQEKGICIAVLAADCVPILLYDPRNRAVGAVHSGWRGTVAKILEKTLQEMRKRYGTRGEDLIACIGPSVCQEAYEVGQEVVAAVRAAFGEESGLLMPQPNGKARLDLWQANKLQLVQFGVPVTQIETAKLCTVLHNEHFFSARKGDSGRFAAGIMLV